MKIEGKKGLEKFVCVIKFYVLSLRHTHKRKIFFIGIKEKNKMEKKEKKVFFFEKGQSSTGVGK